MHWFNECQIVKAELCTLALGCKNGAAFVRNRTGAWRCDPDVVQLEAASRAGAPSAMAQRGAARRVPET